MKRPQSHTNGSEVRETTIETIAAGGRGLGRIDGRAVFVPGALPGERVRVAVTADRSDYWEGRLVDVSQPHPRRRPAPCRWFGDCGGCQMMTAPPDLALELKTGAYLEELGLEAEDAAVVGSPTSLFYRDRVRFQVGSRRKRPVLGFFAPGGRRLIPTPFCHQLNPRINLGLDPIHRWLERIAGFEAKISGVEVLAGGPADGLRITVGLKKAPGRELNQLIAKGPDLEDARGFWTLDGPAKGSVKVKPSEAVTFWARPDWNLSLWAWPGTFTQVNSAVNRILVDDLTNWAADDPPGRVLDLYAGWGNISLPLARIAGAVTAVEQHPWSAAGARRNAEQNHLKNLTVIRGDAAETAAKLAGRGQRFDLVVLDPPRAGAKGLGPTLARLDARKVYYLSCHPAALARDLAELRSFGYSLDRVRAYDMFPQTGHLEILAELRR
jgi:23S rRNA (uracil1939-C5)-methyltransferase